MDSKRFTSKTGTSQHTSGSGRRPALYRGADGKLRPDTGDHEIGDVWAQQRRLQLAEKMAEKRKQANLRRLRRDHGLVGLMRFYVNEAIIRTRIQLFGLDSVAQQPPAEPHEKRAAKRAAAERSQRFAGIVSNVRDWLAALPRKVVIGAGVGLAVVVIGGVLLSSQGGGDGDNPASKASAANDSKPKQPAGLQPGTPEFETVTPGGKDAAQFGGWKRVSPADREPVFAYADTLAGTDIAVSQQLLPADFKRDTAGKVAELAKNFTANDTLSIDGKTVYIGTSAKGPQSVIFNKDDLLILIKSEAIIPDDEWTEYISSLK